MALLLYVSFCGLCPGGNRRSESSPGNEYLDCSSAGHQVENDTDDGEDQQDMDPRADGVHANHTEQPQYEQNDGDCPKHVFSPETCKAISSAVGLSISQPRTASCGKLRGTAMRLPL